MPSSYLQLHLLQVIVVDSRHPIVQQHHLLLIYKFIWHKPVIVEDTVVSGGTYIRTTRSSAWLAYLVQSRHPTVRQRHLLISKFWHRPVIVVGIVVLLSHSAVLLMVGLFGTEQTSYSTVQQRHLLICKFIWHKPVIAVDIVVSATYSRKTRSSPWRAYLVQSRHPSQYTAAP